jgi:hypothetical protein
MISAAPNLRVILMCGSDAQNYLLDAIDCIGPYKLDLDCYIYEIYLYTYGRDERGVLLIRCPDIPVQTLVINRLCYSQN